MSRTVNSQKKFLALVIACALLLPHVLPSRTVLPGVRRMTGAMEIPKEAPPFMFMLTAGVLAGGKQNTCYLLKSRVIIRKIGFDASVYQHFYGDRLYNANVAFGGNLIQLSAGAEFGDRTYFLNRDSTFEHFRFKNLTTGEYEPYSSFAGFSMPQEIVSYNIGLTFGGRFKAKNYWRGVGQCWGYGSCKWEVMYAPEIGYSKTLDITTQGPYQAQTTTYELEGVKVRKWGFRLLFESRLGSKIGFMLETGMRPGVRYELNEEGRFSNGYLRMGVTFGISVGGRKELDRPGFGKAVPEN